MAGNKDEIFFSELVESVKDQFGNTMVYGVPLTELSREELMMVIVISGKGHKSEIDMSFKSLDVVLDLLQGR